jgi:hypothetical protein
VTSDNPKCFALEADRYEPLLNPAFERFAGHYGMRIECLPPADPQKKGKVERLMPYVRRLYEAHGAAWHDLEESQQYLDRKCVLANDRVHGTTRKKPFEQLVTTEILSLKPLPSLAYEPEESAEATVRRDGHVRFDSKYYSCDEKYMGQDVLILATRSHVAIYTGGKHIETHERIPADDAARSKSTKPEHRKPWERELENGSLYRTRAQKLGPDVDRFVCQLLENGQGFVDTRKIWGVLSLDKSYTASEINEACRKAIELGSLSTRMVKSLLKLLPREKGAPSASAAEPVASSDGKPAAPPSKFARPMSVYEKQLKLLH